jgi:hypothetical protein
MPVPWPQTGLVYIAKELVSHPQLPPRIWPPKMPNIPQKWKKSAKYRPCYNKKPKNYIKNPFYKRNWALAPNSQAQPLDSWSHVSATWPRAIARALSKWLSVLVSWRTIRPRANSFNQTPHYMFKPPGHMASE